MWLFHFTEYTIQFAFSIEIECQLFDLDSNKTLLKHLVPRITERLLLCTRIETLLSFLRLMHHTIIRVSVHPNLFTIRSIELTLDPYLHREREKKKRKTRWISQCYSWFLVVVSTVFKWDLDCMWAFSGFFVSFKCDAHNGFLFIGLDEWNATKHRIYEKGFFLHWLTAAIPRQLTEVFVCALGWHTIFLIVWRSFIILSNFMKSITLAQLPRHTHTHTHTPTNGQESWAPKLIR